MNILKKFILTTLVFLITIQIEPLSQFCYNYKTEVFANQCKNSFVLNHKVEHFAKRINQRLNYSPFFNTKYLLQTKNIKKYHLKNKHFKPDNGIVVRVKTTDDVIIECTYFDRQSKKLLVIGGGFTNERELMSPFLHMFLDYDIVIFDYRGHGIKRRLKPINNFFNVNTKETALGAEEEKDVFTIVDVFRSTKKYKQIYGLGICYSALIFIKAQSIRFEKKNEKLFDKIILDGCWITLNDFMEKLVRDPKLLCSPQHGGWSQKWPYKKEWFQKWTKKRAQKTFSHVNFDSVSILPYLEKIQNTPILYFYGKNDLVINHKEFETIWNNLNTEKTAIVTSNPHVRNHIKEKEVYKLICKLLFELKHKNFINCIKEIEYLKRFYANQILQY